MVTYDKEKKKTSTKFARTIASAGMLNIVFEESSPQERLANEALLVQLHKLVLHTLPIHLMPEAAAIDMTDLPSYCGYRMARAEDAERIAGLSAQERQAALFDKYGEPTPLLIEITGARALDALFKKEGAHFKKEDACALYQAIYDAVPHCLKPIVQAVDMTAFRSEPGFTGDIIAQRNKPKLAQLPR